MSKALHSYFKIKLPPTLEILDFSGTFLSFFIIEKEFVTSA